MTRSLVQLLALSLVLQGCSSRSSTGVESRRPEKPSPPLNVVLQARVSAASGEFYLTSYDRQLNRSILTVRSSATSGSIAVGNSRRALMLPTIEESYASGGDGGLTFIPQAPPLEEIDLNHALGAIQSFGVTPGRKLTRGDTRDESEKLVDASGFRPGSTWILTVHDRGTFIVALQLGEQFVPDVEVYRTVQFKYKVLKYSPEP